MMKYMRFFLVGILVLLGMAFSANAQEIAMDISTNKPSSASGYSSLNGGAVNKANDGDPATFWECDFTSQVKHWWQVDLLKKYVITKIDLQTRWGDFAWEKENFEILVSNDPEFRSYEVIGSHTNTPPIGIGEVWTVSPTLLKAYRYVRIQKTVAEYFLIPEFTVYGINETVEITNQSYVDEEYNAVDTYNPTQKNGYTAAFTNHGEVEQDFILALFSLDKNVVCDLYFEKITIPANTHTPIPQTVYLNPSENPGTVLQGVVIKDFSSLEVYGDIIDPLYVEGFVADSVDSSVESEGFFVDYDSMKFHFRASMENPTLHNALFIVTAPDTNAEKTVLTAEDDVQSVKEKLYGFMLQTIEFDGSLSYDVPIVSGANGGFYTLYSGITDYSPEFEFSKYYADETVVDNLYQDIKTATDTELEDLFFTYRKDGDRPVLDLALDLEAYQNNGEEIRKNFTVIRDETDFNGIGDVDKIFKKAVSLYELNYQPITIDSLKTCGNVLEFSFNDFFVEKVYEDTVLQMNVFKTDSGGKFTSQTAAQKAFYDALLIAAINHSDRITLAEIVSFYQGILHLSYGTFAPENVNKTLVDVKYESVAAFISAFQLRLSQLQASVQIPVVPSYGGGGGIGISGSGGGAVSAKPQKKDDELQINDKKEEVQSAAQAVFSDIAGVEWANEAILALYQKGISGKAEKIFAPYDSIKREECAKMLACAFQMETDGKINLFSDVAIEDWFYPYVSAMYERGIINGLGDNSFGVGYEMTRQDFAVLLYRLKKSELASVQDTQVSFSDGDMISEYAKEAVEVLASLKIINGFSDHTFLPHAPITRAEAAKMIYEVTLLTGQGG